MLEKLVADIKHFKKKEGRFPKSHRKTGKTDTHRGYLYTLRLGTNTWV